MNRADAFIGAGLTVAFLIMVWAASRLPYWAEFAPGPGFAPLWFALTGAAVSAYVAFRGFQAPAAPAIGRGGLVRVAMAMVALIVAMALVPFTGFLVSVSAYLLVVTFGIERLRPVVALAAAGGTVAIIYVLFIWILRVPFPKGWFGV